MSVDPLANEASLRFLASEVQRLELLLAQAVGNLALAEAKLQKSLETSTVEEDLEGREARKRARDKRRGDSRVP